MFSQIFSCMLFKTNVVKEPKLIRSYAYHFCRAVLKGRKINDQFIGRTKHSSSIDNYENYMRSETPKHKPSMKYHRIFNQEINTSKQNDALLKYHQNNHTNIDSSLQYQGFKDMERGAVVDQHKWKTPVEKPFSILVDFFLQALHRVLKSSDNESELLSFLFDVSDRELLNSDRFIVDFINSYSIGDLYSKFCSRYPIENEDALKFALFHTAINEADYMIEITIELCRNCSYYPKEDIKLINDILFHCFKLIDLCRQYVTFLRDFELGVSILHKKPPLNKDYFPPNYSSDKEIVEDFYSDQIKNSIRFLDRFKYRHTYSDEKELDIEDLWAEYDENSDCE